MCPLNEVWDSSLLSCPTTFLWAPLLAAVTWEISAIQTGTVKLSRCLSIRFAKSQRIFQQVTKVRWYEDMQTTQANPRFGAWWFWQAFKHIISFWSYGRSGGWDFHRNLEIFLPRWTGNAAAAYRPPPTLQPSSRCLPQSTTVWFLINPQEFGWSRRVAQLTK